MELLLEENPMRHYNPWYGEPRLHARAARKGHRRNPVARRIQARRLMQGVSMTDVSAGVASGAAALMLPRLVIAPGVATPTMTQRWMRLGVAAACALGVGWAARQWIGVSAGNAAVVGGLVGTATEAVNLVSPGFIAGRGAIRALPAGRPVARATHIGATQAPQFRGIELI